MRLSDSNSSKVLFTSDTHFSQKRTYDLSRRCKYYSSVEDMDKDMIDKWNRVVSKNDTVYHLGDFGDHKVASKLNGNIILLYGNYERDSNPSDPHDFEELFTDIIEDDYLVLDECKLLLVHEPSNIQVARRELSLPDNQFYLFGHIHEKQKIKHNGLNVGVELLS